MKYEDVLKAARACIGDSCKVCNICNGMGCKNRIPGPGAKGVGDTAIRNYQKWQEIRVNMDTLHENVPVDTSLELFGKKFRYPFFAGPVGAVDMHYSDKYNDLEYNNILVDACAKAGIVAFTGDGMDPKVVESAAEALVSANGMGVPTIKPWNLQTIEGKLELVKKAKPFAIAMDVDAAGLPFLKNCVPPTGSKTVDELREIVKMAGDPFIVKGIMTVKSALKAEEAGAAAIVVSNHGGRVLDQCPATAEVLPGIVEAVGGRMKVFVDGGIRSGVDIFKALAMGADGVLIARPFVTAVYGGGVEGVESYVEKLGAELADTMAMCGASTLSEISGEVIWRS